MEIIPAVLEKNIDALIERIKLYSSLSHKIHLDIADGVFVNNKTASFNELLQSSISYNFCSLTFDFHLMIKDYMSAITSLEKTFLRNLIRTIFIHVSVYDTHVALPYSFSYGLVLNPEDEVEKYFTVLNTFPSVQLMTVHPGFQGSSFLPEVLDKVGDLKKRGFKGKIILDGGINDMTLKTILKKTHLPNSVCVGSFLKEDTLNRIKSLRSLLNPPQFHRSQRM